MTNTKHVLPRIYAIPYFTYILFKLSLTLLVSPLLLVNRLIGAIIDWVNEDLAETYLDDIKTCARYINEKFINPNIHD